MIREGLIAAVLLLLGACGPSPARERTVAHNQGEQHSGESIAIMRVEPREPAAIVVSTIAQEIDGRLADRHSAYHDNISPPLRWEPVAGAGAYALIVEDPDAPRERPFLHWIAWNIPGQATVLPEGLPNNADPITPQGMVQGRNDMGSYGWFGPRPPAGHGVHRYYFQVFALDEPLAMGASASLEEIVSALKAHTIAEGRMVATYEAPPTQ